MIELLLIALPLLTAIGCFVIAIDGRRKSYTRFFFVLLSLVFLWLFVGEFALQYMGQSILADRFVRGLPMRIVAFIATWSFVIASKIERT